MTRTREIWLARFAAAGPKQSSAEERAEFAELFARELAWAVVWGRRQQDSTEILPRLRDAAIAAREAFRGLHFEIGRTMDGLALHARSAVRLELDGYDRFEDDGLDVIGYYLDRFAELAKAEADNARPHRGPRNGFAVTIAMSIAWTYHDRFGRWPAIGRRGLCPLQSPFDRICDEVEELLHELGHKRVVKGRSNRFTLSDPARKRGIEGAKSGRYERDTNSDPQAESVRATLWFGDRKAFGEHIAAALSHKAGGELQR